jgi:hypothetical protein
VGIGGLGRGGARCSWGSAVWGEVLVGIGGLGRGARGDRRSGARGARCSWGSAGLGRGGRGARGDRREPVPDWAREIVITAQRSRSDGVISPVESVPGDRSAPLIGADRGRNRSFARTMSISLRKVEAISQSSAQRPSLGSEIGLSLSYKLGIHLAPPISRRRRLFCVFNSELAIDRTSRHRLRDPIGASRRRLRGNGNAEEQIPAFDDPDRELCRVSSTCRMRYGKVRQRGSGGDSQLVQIVSPDR